MLIQIYFNTISQTTCTIVSHIHCSDAKVNRRTVEVFISILNQQNTTKKLCTEGRVKKRQYK